MVNPKANNWNLAGNFLPFPTSCESQLPANASFLRRQDLLRIFFSFCIANYFPGPLDGALGDSHLGRQLGLQPEKTPCVGKRD
jgi:hypothetical protein